MKFLKPLVACSLLGLVSLAGCGGKDTEQDTEPQQSQPPPAEQPGSQAEPPRTELLAQEHPICRNLKEGDRGYPDWTYCCDSADKTQSYWTGAKGTNSGLWKGNCYSWGIR